MFFTLGSECSINSITSYSKLESDTLTENLYYYSACLYVRSLCFFYIGQILHSDPLTSLSGKNDYFKLKKKCDLEKDCLKYSLDRSESFTNESNFSIK